MKGKIIFLIFALISGAISFGCYRSQKFFVTVSDKVRFFGDWLLSPSGDNITIIFASIALAGIIFLLLVCSFTKSKN